MHVAEHDTSVVLEAPHHSVNTLARGGVEIGDSDCIGDPIAEIHALIGGVGVDCDQLFFQSLRGYLVLILDLQDVPTCCQVLCDYDPRGLGHDRVGWALLVQDQVCPSVDVAYLCGTGGIDVYSQKVVVGGCLVSLEEIVVEDELAVSKDYDRDYEGLFFRFYGEHGHDYFSLRPPVHDHIRGGKITIIDDVLKEELIGPV